MKNTPSKAHTAISVFLLFIVFSLCLVVAFQFLQPKGRVSCADFGSYEDAQRAYAGGAIWLDRDKDGRPCETRFPKQAHKNYGE